LAGFLQKGKEQEAEDANSTRASSACTGASSMNMHSLGAVLGDGHQGSSRRSQTEQALAAVESWVSELRNAPQGGVRESVEKQVQHLHCCSLTLLWSSPLRHFPFLNPVHTLQAKRGFNKVWARAIRSLPSDKETDTDEDGRRRFDFHQVSDNPPVLLGRIPYDTQTTSPPSLCINSGHRIHGRTAPQPRWLHY